MGDAPYGNDPQGRITRPVEVAPKEPEVRLEESDRGDRYVAKVLEDVVL